MADDTKKKKSRIASLDLKNYKPKYSDPYGDGTARPIESEGFVSETAAEPPKVESKPTVETKPTVESKPIEPAPSTVETQKPIEIEKPIEPPKIETKPIEPPPSTADDRRPIEIKTVSTVETKSAIEKKSTVEDKKPSDKKPSSKKPSTKKNKKVHLREPVKVNVRSELKERPVVGVDPNYVVEENKPYHRRVESYGIAISAVALVYALYTADKALFFLSLSLFTYLIRPLIGPLFGKHNQTVQNALKGFSIAVFFGSILFIFY